MVKNMYALFIILNEVDVMDDILEIFVEVGLRGATILDSQGMGSAIVSKEIRSVPLFGYLKTVLDDNHPYNKTIFSVVNDKQLLDEAVKRVKDFMDLETEEGAGVMFTVPIDNIFGLGNSDK